MLNVSTRHFLTNNFPVFSKCRWLHIPSWVPEQTEPSPERKPCWPWAKGTSKNTEIRDVMISEFHSTIMPQWKVHCTIFITILEKTKTWGGWRRVQFMYLKNNWSYPNMCKNLLISYCHLLTHQWFKGLVCIVFTLVVIWGDQFHRIPFYNGVLIWHNTGCVSI